MVVADGSVTRSLVDMYKRCVFEVLRDGSAVTDDGEALDKSFSEVYPSVYISTRTASEPAAFSLVSFVTLEWFPRYLDVLIVHG